MKVAVEKLNGVSYEKAVEVLKSAGYYKEGGAVDSESPKYSLIEDEYWVLEDEEEEEIDRVSYARYYNETSKTGNEPEECTIVKEEWETLD